MKHIIIGLLLVLCSTFTYASRKEILLNNDWMFRFSHQVQKKSEQRVNLPHTWNSSDALSGKQDYYRGMGNYEKTLFVKPEWKGKRLFLRFEGVNTIATVFVNSVCLGEHRGGYGAFVFEITDKVQYGAENKILVKVNNALQLDIMPLVGDFNFYGGIYRDVNLIITDPVNISLTDYASPGVYLIQNNVTKEQADVKAKVLVSNGSSTSKPVQVNVKIWDGNKIVQQQDINLTVDANQIHTAGLEFSIKNPHLWNGRKDPFMYRTEVTLLADGQEIDKVTQPLGLRFYHVDAEKGFFLNGEHLGDAFNMHRIWEYDIREKVKPAENELRVVLHSPNKYIREAFRECRTLGNDDTLEGFVHIRKAHYMFGWDWGAHLPDAGIFRPVTLLGIDRGRIDNVLILQQHERVPEADSDRAIAALGNRSVSRVTLQLQVTEETAGITDGVPKLMDVTGGRVFGGCGQHMSYQAEITAPDGTKAVYEDSPTEIVIEEPKLWWPNGYGAQDLYTVKVVLYSDGREIDCWEKRIGLRTMNMRREKDEWGESFAHEINGVAFFAMGGDYIPEEHLLGRRSEEKTRQLLLDCKRANFNVIRVWGGGFYPDEWFYDICDELGLAVWQDFMFACSVYELTEAFETNIY